MLKITQITLGDTLFDITVHVSDITILFGQYDTPSTVASSSLGSSSAQGSSSVTPAALGLVSSAAQAGTNTASTKVTSSTAGT